MDLVDEMTLRGTLDPHTQMVGPGPAGMRAVVTVTGKGRGLVDGVEYEIYRVT